MNDAVNVNSSPSGNSSGKTDFLANARAAWGDALPDWLEELAKLANATSGAHAARRIGYSASVVTSLFKGCYAGDIGAVEIKVRGALMRETVICPVLDEISKDHCLDEQKKDFTGTSALRTSVYHACRNGCPHSRLKVSGGEHG